MQIAWEMYNHMVPHLAEGHGITRRGLFEEMPISFPDDIPAAKPEGTAHTSPERITTDERSELERRRNLKRVTRPR